HTIGSTSLIVNDAYIMTGDTLFIESIGRPDLAGKADDWVEDLHKTLYKRFRNLSAELIVLPGHFGSMEEINQDSTIQSPLKELYRNNELLQVNDKQQFIKLVTNHLPEQPNSHEQIRKINMGKTNPNEEERQEMEVGPNRCAVSTKVHFKINMKRSIKEEDCYSLIADESKSWEHSSQLLYSLQH